MIRAAVVTPWIAAADDHSPLPANHPQFNVDYTYIRWEDITGQPSANIPTDPNEYTILVEMTDEVYDVLTADPDYEVLWAEKIEEQPHA